MYVLSDPLTQFFFNVKMSQKKLLKIGFFILFPLLDIVLQRPLRLYFTIDISSWKKSLIKIKVYTISSTNSKNFKNTKIIHKKIIENLFFYYRFINALCYKYFYNGTLKYLFVKEKISKQRSKYVLFNP